MEKTPIRIELSTKFTIMCIAVLIFHSCSLIDTPERMFKIQVLDPIPDDVSNIRFLKDYSAMHGPMFFRFSSSEPVITSQKIINKHNLRQMSAVPEEISAINDAATSQVDWWRQLPDLSRMDIYAINYVPKSGIGDFHVRCLFVEGEEMYFATTGFFITDDYQVGNK